MELPVISLGIKHGEHGDICDDTVFNIVRGWIASYMVADVWCGTPCNSFSRARRGPIGGSFPAQIRSARRPRDIPGLVGRDARTVRIGTKISDRSGLLLNEAHARPVPAFEENPAYSYSWSPRSRRQQLNRPNVRDYIIDHCTFGSRFRKRTRIRCFHARDNRLLKATCTSSRGCCSYTGQPHVILSGINDRDFATKA